LLRRFASRKDRTFVTTSKTDIKGKRQSWIPVCTGRTAAGDFMKDLTATLIQTELIWEDIPANLAMFDRKIDGISEKRISLFCRKCLRQVSP